MGFASFLENIVERYIEPYSEKVALLAQGSATGSGPRVIYCPLCPESFLDEEMIDRHVANAHGRQHVYLKINGRIVRDICWTAQPLKECTLVLLQIPELRVSFDVDGKESQCVLHKTGNLKSYLAPMPQEGCIKIRTAEPFPRTFTIYLGRQPTFQAHRLDEALIALMQQLRQGSAVDLIGFREKRVPPNLNELETRYLQGVLEYCHAWQLEAKDDHQRAKDRLEESMGLLMPFKTPLADELRNALSFKMNCFAGQWGCDADSPFRVAERFFCLQARQSDDVPVRHAHKLRIPLDTVSRRILDALKAYYENDNLTVFGILLELRRGVRLKGRNDEDKLTLLEARTRERGGDIHAAAELYKTLLDHPIFGKEAKRQVELQAAS
jgi:hypothetical protein